MAMPSAPFFPQYSESWKSFRSACGDAKKGRGRADAAQAARRPSYPAYGLGYLQNAT